MEKLNIKIVELFKKIVIAICVVAIAGSGLLCKPVKACAETLNDANSSNSKWSTYYLDPSLTKLDTATLKKNRGEGPIDPNRYNHEGDYIDSIFLRIDIDMLSVQFNSHHDSFLGDVDYRFTIVAQNYDGEIEARFCASGDTASIFEDYEQIWQSDCIEGDKSIVRMACDYDGVFYVEKVEVAD